MVMNAFVIDTLRLALDVVFNLILELRFTRIEYVPGIMYDINYVTYR